MCFQAKFHAKLSSGSEALHTSSQKAWLDAQHHSEGRVFGVLQKVHHIQNPYRFIDLVRWKHKLRKSCLPKTPTLLLANSCLSIIPGAAATWQWGHTNTDPGTGLGGWGWWWRGGEGCHQKMPRWQMIWFPVRLSGLRPASFCTVPPWTPVNWSTPSCMRFAPKCHEGRMVGFCLAGYWNNLLNNFSLNSSRHGRNG